MTEPWVGGDRDWGLGCRGRSRSRAASIHHRFDSHNKSLPPILPLTLSGVYLFWQFPTAVGSGSCAVLKQNIKQNMNLQCGFFLYAVADIVVIGTVFHPQVLFASRKNKHLYSSSTCADVFIQPLCILSLCLVQRPV